MLFPLLFVKLVFHLTSDRLYLSRSNTRIVTLSRPLVPQRHFPMVEQMENDSPFASLKDKRQALAAVNSKLEDNLMVKLQQANILKDYMQQEKEEHCKAIRSCEKKLQRLNKKIESRKRFLKSQQRQAKGKVVLDVGGTRFTTSVSTLGDSLLATLFYGHVEVEEDCYFGDGVVFIDRDPHAFRCILQWLRTGVLPMIKDGSELKMLLHEASFYGLNDLVKQLNQYYKDAFFEEEEATHNSRQRGWIKISPEFFLDLVNRPAATLKLNGCDLRGFDFFRMDLRKANFHRCNLDGVNMGQTKLDGACFVECSMKYTCLKDAELCGADLSRSDCTGADFQNADLKDVIFQGSNLSETLLYESPDKVQGTELDSDDL